MPKIRKPWVDWETFNQITGFTWTPAAHTHVKTDITNTPWAWADVLKAGSNLTDLATRQHAGLTDVTSDQHHPQAHAASHHVGGGDLLAFASITGFGTYLDQAVKQASLVSFAKITDTGTGATNLAAGTTGTRPAGIVGDIRYNSTLGRFEAYTGAWKSVMLVGDPLPAHAATHEVGGGDLLDFASITGFGDYLDQAVKQASNPTFNLLTLTNALYMANSQSIRFRNNADNDYLFALALNASDVLNIAADSGITTVIVSADVGIGKVPTEKLDVNGIVKADNFYLQAGVTPTLSWLSDCNITTELNGQIISHWDGEWLNRWGYETDLPPIAYKLITEFTGYSNDASPPWVGYPVGSGTMAGVAGTSNHPGILKFSSAAFINNGYRFTTEVDAFLIAGGEVCEFVFQLKRLFTTRVKCGFKDTLGWSDPTDGVWLDIRYVAPNGGIFTGKTASNTAISTTATSYQLVVDTWYRARLQITSDATEVIYSLYSMAGVILWTNTLTTNIPTGTGRTCGHGIIATHDAAQAFDLIWVDFMTAVRIGTLQRGG